MQNLNTDWIWKDLKMWGITMYWNEAHFAKWKKALTNEILQFLWAYSWWEVWEVVTLWIITYSLVPQHWRWGWRGDELLRGFSACCLSTDPEGRRSKAAFPGPPPSPHPAGKLGLGTVAWCLPDWSPWAVEWWLWKSEWPNSVLTVFVPVSAGGTVEMLEFSIPEEVKIHCWDIWAVLV